VIISSWFLYSPLIFENIDCPLLVSTDALINPINISDNKAYVKPIKSQSISKLPVCELKLALNLSKCKQYLTALP